MSLIQTTHLFPILDDKLIALLRSLTPAEWNKPTVARLWTVKDVAAHLLDTNIRTLSIARDNYMGDPPGSIQSNDDLLAYLNGLNADWVKAMKRTSPQVLTEMLEITGKQFSAFIAAQDLFAPATFPVNWAGETESLQWFHIAREFTEKWHHQQQIRDAVGKEGIMTKELYYPVLDTFLRALPYTYRHTTAPQGTTLQFTITGEGGGNWYLVMNKQWELHTTISTAPTAHTTIDGHVAWKLLTKSWRRKDVMNDVTITGNHALGDVILDMISVMA